MSKKYLFFCSHFWAWGLIVVTGTFLLSADLYAQSPVRIESIDTSAYPLNSVQVSIKRPYPSLLKHKAKVAFQVYETSHGLEREVSELQVTLLRRGAERLNLVWIVDASLSVDRHRFVEALAFSKDMIGQLTNRDRMAIYSVAEEPKLIMDFSHETDALMKAVSSIHRHGKITRLYDAIYSGLYTAQNLASSQAGQKGESRTVLVLLTDGQEESSYLSADDCFELSSVGKRHNIPVYMLLFNGKVSTHPSHPAKKKAVNHYRFLRRLALKTQGAFIEDPLQMHLNSSNFPDNESKPEARQGPSRNFMLYLRQLPYALYQIRYHSLSALDSLSGRQMSLRVTLREGSYGDTAFVKLPWYRFLQKRSFVFISILSLFSLMSVMLAFVLVVQARRNTNKFLAKKWDRDSGPSPILNDIPDAEQSMAENPSSTLHPPSQFTQQEQTYSEKEAWPMSASEWNKTELLPYTSVGPRILMEDERILYLREHSYRMLQLALRRAVPYQHATLSITSDELPKKRVYDLFLESTVLGNGRWAHIPVRDPAASPLHARIKKIDQRFVVYDLMSGSGLYVNQAKVLRPLGLKNGDEIRIGRKRFTFLGRNNTTGEKASTQDKSTTINKSTIVMDEKRTQ